MNARSIKHKLSLVLILSLILILSSACGSSSTTASGDTTKKELSKEQFDQLYTDANAFKGYSVNFYCRVFLPPEKSDGYISVQAYANNDDSKNTIIRIDNPSFDIKEDDILHIQGTVLKMFEGTNAFGAKLRIPAIVADKVEKADYATAFSPAIKTIDVNQEQNQYGYILTVSKVELAEKETRVFVKIKNSSASNISIYTSSAKLVQGDKQYETMSSYGTDYPEVESDLLPNIASEGIVLFEPIDPSGENFKIMFTGSSTNYDIDIKPFVFEIPLKNSISSAEQQPQVTSNNNAEAVKENKSSNPTDIFSTLTYDQKRSLNIFFSNFSEAYFNNFDISNYDDSQLIQFAILHNIINYGDRIKYSDNEAMLEEKYVAQVIKRFFNVDVNHGSVNSFEYRNGSYVWPAADGEQYWDFSQVENFYDNGDGTFTANLVVYSAGFEYEGQDIIYDPKDEGWGNDITPEYRGTAQAVVKKADINGKQTYQLLKYQCNF